MKGVSWASSRLLVPAVAAALGAAATWQLARARTAGAGVEAVEPLPASVPAPRTEEPLRWLAIGGGPTPEYNEASIEQDLALAVGVLGPRGRVLFAGGPGAVDVRELAPSLGGDPLRLELGEIFAPRSGRHSRYRRTRLKASGPATLPAIESELGRELEQGDGPLVVVFEGHGDRGSSPRENALGLWGGGSLSAEDLAAILDRSHSARPVQLVMTTCYGGGFADVVFAGASPARGAPATLRCGFFATSADLPASGCDPDPDRSHQESYAMQFWHALAGEDEHGAKLPLEALDLDGDGVISPLEAHARARIAGTEVDVPTTTSERWLRARAPARGPEKPVRLSEEEAVVAALGEHTGLGADAGRVESRLAALQDEEAAAEQTLEDRQADEDDAYGPLSGELLARWPVLDDPWHPGFAALLERDHDAIARWLASSPEYAAYRAAMAATDAADEATWEIQRRMAPVARLARALETIELARRLAARGGPDWDAYRALLACERRPF